MRIFIASDLHFNHENIIKYSNRPFKDTQEMNAKLIVNWNKAVTPEDTVYFLGDFSFGRHSITYDRNFFNQLNGHKKIVLGNHDRHFNVYDGVMKIGSMKTPEEAIAYWREVGFEEVFNNPIILDDYFILSHKPIDGINHTQIFANIHGHTHNINMTDGNYFNASLESINYAPIDFEEIKEHFVNEN